MTGGDPILDIRGLATEFHTSRGPVRAVDGIDLSVGPGETVALVGESGCGKTTTAFSVLRLIPRHRGRVVAGEIRFDRLDLATLDERSLRRIRGNRIAMIFQDPASALNPLMTVGAQIAEAVRLHRGLGRAAARAETEALLRAVRIPEPRRRLDEFPHQLSGGMRQRVMIALALSCRPRLLIADEPTTALDVTVQAQILALIEELKQEFGMSVLLITHDLAVVAEVADRVAVMYAGRKVEEAPVSRLFAAPRHPYTRALLASIPDPDADTGGGAAAQPLPEIPGRVQPAGSRIEGCAFAERCAIAADICRQAAPPEALSGDGAAVFCHHAAPEDAGQIAAAVEGRL
ncbi:ABC transporter ATP-binding protein [Paralimibaculum aggregatum]|uniref:ABC transporter ATP-binding protein n=1 Tax=Paralimibaculum aggregatum TaxID=3036245 RepID=A0ABQ6LSI3_9RHOB|nr:ABC transporter ATP-binding protein [Limibaculum sp. NKW23]GMG85026.1 ABC transporter ATP-binding protein [Limibaculum sp. NKW23]